MNKLKVVFTTSAAGKTYLNLLDGKKYFDAYDSGNNLNKNDADFLMRTRGSAFDRLINFIENQPMWNLDYQYIFSSILHTHIASPESIEEIKRLNVEIIFVLPDPKYKPVIDKRLYERNVHQYGKKYDVNETVECIDNVKLDYIIHFAKENNIEIIYLNEQCPYLENALDLYERKHGLK